MTRMEDLLKELGRRASPESGALPPVDAEALAEAHQRSRSGQGPAAELAPWATEGWMSLFSPEALEGEADVGPSPRALGAVAALVKEGPGLRAMAFVLRMVDDALEVIRHTGELLSPQPLAVRGAAAALQPAASHTFRQRLLGFDASVGLEAEGDGRFGITLTLEGDGVEDPALRVTLWEGGRRRAVQSGDGAVHIGGLRRGSYRLEVSAEGDAVGAIDLEVQDGDMGD